MSTRNGSYARHVDAQTAKSSAPKKAEPAKASPSPQSARPAFDDSKANALARKAKRARSSHGATPVRAPHPKGMGETSVNWQAHIKREQVLRDEVQNPHESAERPSAAMAAKARKAARNLRTASPAPEKDQSPSR